MSNADDRPVSSISPLALQGEDKSEAGGGRCESPCSIVTCVSTTPEESAFAGFASESRAVAKPPSADSIRVQPARDPAVHLRTGTRFASSNTHRA